MKKFFFMAATAALALSSCSSDEIVQTEQPVEDGAVLFSAYSGRNTRATTEDGDATDGDAQNVTKKYLQGHGFGVFAYDQDQQQLVSYLASNTYPNFMYNQKVAAKVATWEFKETITRAEFEALGPNATGYYISPSSMDQTVERAGGGENVLDEEFQDILSPIKYSIAIPKSFVSEEWEYSPLKYWPNHGGYVTYQAYAPYNPDVTPIFNVAYKGVGIRYNNAEGKDLLWGANAAEGESTCYYDQQKPGTQNKTLFHFRHALAKLDFTVSYFSDNDAAHATEETTTDGEKPLDKNTQIVIRSIRLVGDLPSQGVLSLYDGSWTIEKTEANAGYNTADLVMKNESAEVASSDDTWDEIDDAKMYGTLTKDVLAVKPAGSLMVIPTKGTAGKVHVEITYDVITKDSNDDRNSSIVTNTVCSKDVVAGGSALYPDAHSFAGLDLDAGKHTTINIHLGMTSAKFDAKVVDWDTSDSKDVDLPNNKPGTDPAPAPTPSNRR